MHLDNQTVKIMRGDRDNLGLKPVKEDLTGIDLQRGINEFDNVLIPSLKTWHQNGNDARKKSLTAPNGLLTRARAYRNALERRAREKTLENLTTIYKEVRKDVFKGDEVKQDVDSVKTVSDDFKKTAKTYFPVTREEAMKEAEEVAKAAIKALGLRSSTAHIELMRTDDGWKVVEVGARIGGFRNDLYKLAFGIDHGINDILIRIPQKPVVPKKNKGFACAMQFYPEKEGTLTQLKGIKKIQELKSIHKVKVNKKLGDKCLFAKHGGKSVVDVILFNKERSKLLADIRRIEKSLEIVTE